MLNEAWVKMFLMRVKMCRKRITIAFHRFLFILRFKKMYLRFAVSA